MSDKKTVQFLEKALHCFSCVFREISQDFDQSQTRQTAFCHLFRGHAELILRGIRDHPPSTLFPLVGEHAKLLLFQLNKLYKQESAVTSKEEVRMNWTCSVTLDRSSASKAASTHTLTAFATS